LRIKANIQTGMEQIEGLRERLTPDYPQIALRELLFNAVMHRSYQSNTPIRFYWYSDRIEIQNSGGLYGDVTPETLTQICSYRNPIVADCMKSLGFVNRFGYGIQRAMSMLQDNGNPAPEFKIDDKVFLVTIRRRPE
ncbi:MAG: transcriptional regulator, partial [Spirochaetia bacterium]|nr:transcriptional regulator [Spirochaetia bacterium]